MRFVALLVLSLVAACVSAGQLSLKNGDQITGNMLKIDGDAIVWKAVFGEIKVPKNLIVGMALDGEFRLNGFSHACTVDGFSKGVITAVCGGKKESVDLGYLTIAETWVAPDERNVAYSGKASLTAQRKTGNENEEDIDLEVKQVWKATDIEHELDFMFESLSVDEQASDESYELAYQNNWFFKPAWYWANSLSYSMSEPKNIDEQYRAGTGLGHVIWKGSKGELKGLFGVAYQEIQYFLPADPAEEDYLSASWALDFNYTLFDSVQFFHSHQLFQSMDDTDDLEAKAQTGFSMPLYKNLHGEAKHEWDYDKTPSAGARKVDTKFTLGVSYGW